MTGSYAGLQSWQPRPALTLPRLQATRRVPMPNPACPFVLQDPYSFGAYSYVPPNGKKAYYDCLGHPGKGVRP